MKTTLLFGVHMHQPVDNLFEAVENAVKSCYGPFFKLLSRYDTFKFALHSSGWILRYIKDNHADIFEDIKKCNIEFFTGGYYEPVLASIDKESQIAQIQQLNEFIYENFKQRPKGLWLTERVWDDNIISSLKQCGVLYSIVDDYHLYSSGIKDIDGFYTTEEAGDKLSLFPVNKDLRYAIPFWQVDDAIHVIENKECAIIFDDLEKFGLWPKTYELVYESGWLKEFIEHVLASKEIESRHFNEYFEQNSSKGLVYLQDVSYFEMNEWSLKKIDIEKYERYGKLLADDSMQFLRGGLWKNFFLKYSESNRIHKRMMEFRQLKSDSFYKLQTNDVFWHGAFGGIYLPNLRDNAYRYLIECENASSTQGIEVKDVEMTGYAQIKIPTENMIFRFSCKGGSLIEFDDRENLFNYQNTLMRREEFYHENLLTSKEDTEQTKGVQTIHNIKHTIDENIKKQIYFDTYERLSFMDFISSDFLPDKFIGGDFHTAKDFSKEVFKENISNQTLIFEHENLIKQYNFINNGFDFDFELNFEGTYTYILEINLHFAHYDDLLLNNILVQDKGVMIAKEFVFKDAYGKRDIAILFDEPKKLSYFLIKTFSQSESGFDSIIQGISMAFTTDFMDKASIKGKIVCQK